MKTGHVLRALRGMVTILLLIGPPGILSKPQQIPQMFWMGRVTSVEQGRIHASSGPQGTLTNLTITLASGGKVWKKTTRQDFSAIRVGDEILMRGYRVALGELAATDVWANITKISGHILDVSGNRFRVSLVDVGGRPRGEEKTVLVDAGTVTDRDLPLSMRDVQKGRYVETIGLKMPDGTIAATRVTVFVNGRPVDMPANVQTRDARGNPVRK